MILVVAILIALVFVYIKFFGDDKTTPTPKPVKASSGDTDTEEPETEEPETEEPETEEPDYVFHPFKDFYGGSNGVNSWDFESDTSVIHSDVDRTQIIDSLEACKEKCDESPQCGGFRRFNSICKFLHANEIDTINQKWFDNEIVSGTYLKNA